MKCKLYLNKAVYSRGGRNWADGGQGGKEDFLLYTYLYFLLIQHVTLTYSKANLKNHRIKQN